MNRVELVLLYIILPLLIVSCGKESPEETETNIPIVLVTDFGEGNYWIGQLKGIILNTCPDAEIIDGTHSVTPFDVKEGAYLIHTITREFPDSIITIGIVDPGVPGEERYLILLTERKQIFIAPDNGLLTYIYKKEGIKELYEVTNDALFDAPIESLFVTEISGRIAGLIASGLSLQEIGSEVTDPEEFDLQEPVIIADTLLGEVIYIDNFGNCLTNIQGQLCDSVEFEFGDSLILITDDTNVVTIFGNTYSDVPLGEPVIFVNLRDKTVEMAINMGNFAGVYSIDTGEDVKIIEMANNK